MFGLDGTYTWREGPELAKAGWWREPGPIPMDLTSDKVSYWQSQLSDLADHYDSLASELRLRVDTCVDWLDVAALSDNWRIIIPAVFSAMEAILVPGTSAALKAGMVTVRSTAVHVAMEKPFFDPGEVMTGYKLRSDLVHGTPTTDVPQKQAQDLAEDACRRAFEVLCDYLKVSKIINAETAADIVSYLDGGSCKDICAWLEDHGGSLIVTEYRNSLGAEPG